MVTFTGKNGHRLLSGISTLYLYFYHNCWPVARAQCNRVAKGDDYYLTSHFHWSPPLQRNRVVKRSLTGGLSPLHTSMGHLPAVARHSSHGSEKLKM
ncbi:1955_t:CDS:2 [Funneliformis caledonium]|uniref:1955_t:CDS:1 n=1 Tax=Funneliformis caledonium TaxID=1117310 RepID=A0A9N8W6A6_9GLOM|nr:1955_t:CDS:2 [Funneliformis caledonium]